MGNIVGEEKGDCWVSSGGYLINTIAEQLRCAYDTELWIPDYKDIRELASANDNLGPEFFDETENPVAHDGDEPTTVDPCEPVPMAAYSEISREEDQADVAD